MDWEPKIGAALDGRPIERCGRMRALVYFGRGHFELVDDRPIVCTSHDVVARVDFVHRCGTDVKIFRQGRPDQLDDSLLAQLRRLLNLKADYNPQCLRAYVDLVQGRESCDLDGDAFYSELRAALAEMSREDRKRLWPFLRRHWGRILGHEMVVTVERVGSKVHALREGIGYLAGRTLTEKDLDFRPRRRYIVQTRIARYWPPRVRGSVSEDTRGIQLLGRNITDLAMEMNAAYAQAVRLTPEIIQSGSVIPVPEGLDDIQAAMVEPAACLLDCFEKTAHEVGEDDSGVILKKGVMRGGVAAVIGSGSMGILAGRYALMEDAKIDVGGAREVVFFVRSEQKRELVRERVGGRAVFFVVSERGASEEAVLHNLREQYARPYQDRCGGAFEGFDDVIVCAGGPDTVRLAHKMLVHTGGRVMAFAGTRGPIDLESGVWHYGNAGTIGTSGCNTKMMEIVLALVARGRVSLQGLTGRVYTLSEVGENPQAFFDDNYLRPAIAPNKETPPIVWSE